MPALDETLQQKLQLLEIKQRSRRLKPTRILDGAWVERAGRRLVSFSGNDYLGLSRHPTVAAAAQAALAEYGAGAGASRLVSGDHPLYGVLEAALAVYKGTQAACVFGSGYLANLGAITALAGTEDVILADKYAHASMLDAARLSGATLLRFAHNNVAHARMLLEAHRHEHHHCLILTETVFSMDGDRAPLAELKAIAAQFDAWLMTDDAHGLGVLPKAQSDADIQLGTLSKALGGYGGYVCGSHLLVEYLHNAARSLIYSTGLPPATVAAASVALAIIENEPERVALPLQRARYFTALLGLPDAQSAIVPLVLKDNNKALAAAKQLQQEGFLVTAIRPPTVPEGTARLRFAFSALHSEAQIAALAQAMQKQGFLCAS